MTYAPVRSIFASPEQVEIWGNSNDDVNVELAPGVCPEAAFVACELVLAQVLSQLTGIRATIPITVVAWWNLLDPDNAPLKLSGDMGEALASEQGVLMLTLALIGECVLDLIPCVAEAQDAIMVAVKPVLAFALVSSSLPPGDDWFNRASMKVMQVLGPGLAVITALADDAMKITVDAGSGGCLSPLRSTMETGIMAVAVPGVLLFIPIAILMSFLCTGFLIVICCCCCQKMFNRKDEARGCCGRRRKGRGAAVVDDSDDEEAAKSDFKGDDSDATDTTDDSDGSEREGERSARSRTALSTRSSSRYSRTMSPARSKGRELRAGGSARLPAVARDGPLAVRAPCADLATEVRQAGPMPAGLSVRQLQQLPVGTSFMVPQSQSQSRVSLHDCRSSAGDLSRVLDSRAARVPLSGRSPRGSGGQDLVRVTPAGLLVTPLSSELLRGMHASELMQGPLSARNPR